MLLKKIVAMVTAFGVGGCSALHHPPPSDVGKHSPTPSISVEQPIRTAYKPPLSAVTLPPDIATYQNIGDDVIVLKNYATDLNWYMFYLFSYTHVINQFAIQRGWEPPKTAPLCKTFAWPKQMEVPFFEYKEGMSLEDLDVELTLFISEAKARYQEQQKLFDEAEMWQRRLCMY